MFLIYHMFGNFASVFSKFFWIFLSSPPQATANRQARRSPAGFFFVKSRPAALPAPCKPHRLVTAADITGALGIGSTITGNIQGALKGLAAKKKDQAAAATEQLKTDNEILKGIFESRDAINQGYETDFYGTSDMMREQLENASSAARDYFHSILDGNGSLEDFEKKQKSAIKGMQQSTVGAKASAAAMQLFQVAANGLAGTLISMAVSLAVNALINLFTNHGPSMEEMIEKTQELREEYDSLVGELQNLQTGLEDTNAKIKELESVQAPTLVQQEELDKLRDASAEYEKQIALLEIQAKYKAKETNESARETLESQQTDTFYSYRDISHLKAAIANSTASDEFKKTLNSINSGVTRSEFLEIAGEALEALDPESDAYEDLVDKILEIQTQADDLANSIVEVDGQSREDKKAAEALRDYAAYLLDPEEMLEPLLSGILEQDSFAKTREQLEQLAKSGKLDAATISQYATFTSELEKVGVTAEDAARGLRNMVDEKNNPPISELAQEVQNSVTQMKSSLSELQSALSTLDSAIGKNNNGEFFSTSEIINLITLYPQLADKVQTTANGFRFEAGALEEVRRAQLEAAKSRMQTEIAQTKATIQNCQSRIAAYSAELRAFTSVKSIDEAILLEQNKINAYSANQATYAANWKEIDESQAKISALEAYRVDLASYQDNQKALEDAESQLKALEKSMELLENTTVSYTGATNGSTRATEQQTNAINKQKAALEQQKSALQEQREILQKQREELQAAQQQMQDDQSAINSLLDLTMNMLQKKYDAEQKAEEEAIDRLEEKYDAIKKTYEAENEAIQESINLKKEALEQQKEERDYQRELEEHRANILELETQLNTLRLDQSASAQKHAMELEEELAEAKQELDDFLYEHETQAQLDALERQSEETDNYYQQLAEKADLELEHEKEVHNAKLEQLKEYLDGDVNLRNEAIALINARTDAFYQSLLDYNQKYGSGIDAEIKQQWDACYEALDRYNDGQLNTLAILNMLVASAGLYKDKISGLDGELSGLDDQISNIDKQITDAQNRLSNLDSQVSTTASRILALNNMEKELAGKREALAKLKQQWGQFSNSYSDMQQGYHGTQIILLQNEITGLEKLIKSYTYHTGGIVGDRDFASVGAHNVTSAMRNLIANLDGNEVVAKLQVGEAVLTQRQQRNLFRLLDSRNAPVLTLPSGNSGASVVMGDIIVQGSADKTTVAAIRKVQEETVELVFNKMNKLRRKAGVMQYASDIG